MRVSDSVTFDNPDRQEIYDHVERHGTVPKDELMGHHGRAHG